MSSQEINFEFLNKIQLITLCLLASMGITRAIILRSKNTKVLVVDSQITKIQSVNGIFFSVSFLIWIFESISYSLSLNDHVPVKILGLPLIENSGIRSVGVILLTLGLFIYAASLHSMRDSWRIGIDRENPGKLIKDGIFKYSRNPIYISLDLLVIGTFFLQGRIVFLLLFLCIASSLHIQILQEEKYLLETYGKPYLDYQSKVGRYIGFKRR